MNDPRDESQNAEEQERLYREREMAAWAADNCVPLDVELTPDVDPVIPAEKCGDEDEILTAEFVEANPVPPGTPDPDLLPDPLSVVSQEVSHSCPVGRVALAGTDPTILAAGADVQLVYLDEIDGIAQSELFRLAAYVYDLQAHVTTSLVGAIDLDDFTAFDQGIVTISKTSAAVAALIRTALVAAQETADDVAQSIAVSSLVCGWFNQELWVTCQTEAPGYAIHLTDPGAAVKAYIAAGLFSSTISQSDANAQAARSAALELTCLVTNTEQDVSCSDVDGAVSDELTLTWPVNWTKAAVARDAALGIEVVTLEQQGADTWVVADWDDMESNTETIELGDLNGQEFMSSDLVGSPERRRLRTRVIIEAGDPRTASIDLETANEIAYNLAVAELDCFVPNRPRLISCITPTYGSEEVARRHTARGRAMNSAGRALTHTELLGGDPNVYGGPAYPRTNVGVVAYGGATEREDRTVAFEVYVWPGYFAGSTASEVEDVAGNYGASFLQCLWISPYHACVCVSGSSPGMSAKFSASTITYEGVKLQLSKSSTMNAVPRGLMTDTEYPNRRADTDYNDATLVWPDLPAICQASLVCVFGACKTVCCEPKPDDRPYKVNGLPNYATWGANWLTGAAKVQHQSAFINAWNQRRAQIRFNGCVGYDKDDDCNIPMIPVSGSPSSIVAVGYSNGEYGTPARFKYGGILRWGYQWAEESAPDPDDPTNATLSLIGTVKSCHKNGNFTQLPDPWGLFHCAEGYAEGFLPEGLGEIARQNALARLDCTHINWPRHLANCPEPNQKGFGPAVNLNLVIEASSTRDANEQMENMLLQLMSCRDMHNFMITFQASGGNAILRLPGVSVVSGSADACLPAGNSDMKLYKDCEELAEEIEAAESSHVFIVVKCCYNDVLEKDEKRLILKLVPDSAIDSEMTSVGRQTTGLGLPSGRDALETLRETESEVWYIGSFSVADLGNGNAAWEANRSVAQAHTGPIIIKSGCCGGSELWGITVVPDELNKVKISNPGIIKKTTALDDSGVVDVIGIDDQFAARVGSLLGIEFKRDSTATMRVMAPADLEGWPYPITTKESDPPGFFILDKYFYAIWDFRSDRGEDPSTVQIGKNLFAEKRGFSSHLQMMLTRQEDKNGKVVSTFELVPSVGCRKPPE
jgi:hypothetical protein